MFAALGTTVCFAITPIFANRATQWLGSIPANFWRLVLAGGVLAAWTHVFGHNATDPVQGWFFLAGVVGFGVGGLAMFLSLPRLGSSLSTLVVQCGSAIAAAVIERAWLGARLNTMQAVAVGLTIAGVGIGLLPRSLPRVAPQQFRAGLAWAVTSAFGQGAGAVLSRKAFLVAAALGEKIDPGSAAYYRVLGGLTVAAVALAGARIVQPSSLVRGARGWGWVIGNAVTGPILGVTCYQWALRSTPATLVQPVVAAAPLLTVPLAIALEGAARPQVTYYAGAVLAIAGETLLLLSP